MGPQRRRRRRRRWGRARRRGSSPRPAQRGAACRPRHLKGTRGWGGSLLRPLRGGGSDSLRARVRGGSRSDSAAGLCRGRGRRRTRAARPLGTESARGASLRGGRRPSRAIGVKGGYARPRPALPCPIRAAAVRVRPDALQHGNGEAGRSLAWPGFYPHDASFCWNLNAPILGRSQPALIIAMVMRLVSVSACRCKIVRLAASGARERRRTLRDSSKSRVGGCHWMVLVGLPVELPRHERRRFWAILPRACVPTEQVEAPADDYGARAAARRWLGEGGREHRPG
jgi:hypothetical protein